MTELHIKLFREVPERIVSFYFPLFSLDFAFSSNTRFQLGRAVSIPDQL